MPGSGLKIQASAGTLTPVESTAFNVGQGGGSPGYPNRPVGLNTILYIPGDYLPPMDNSIYPSATGGQGYLRRATGYTAADLTVFNGLGSNWWRTRWRAGGSGGPAPGTGVCTVTGGPSASNPAADTPNYDTYYYAFRIRPYANLQNSLTGMKMCMIGTGGGPSGIQQIVPMLKGYGGTNIHTDWPVAIHVQGIGSTYVRYQNLNLGNQVKGDLDNQIEILLRQSQVDQSDGTADMWVNNIHVLSHTDMLFRVTGQTKKFYGLKFYQNMTGLTRTQLDYIDFRDMLVATL